ncbi:hypothetical protein V0288_22535 [Pannus brasiliensis CCIBt3594]|uniref:Uncharacterized protein n=1 Tax=Pannus brasiliensis CCIBt3594 TaxID=1427578 RepID=A0AAW9QQ63_9CHRO
MLENGLSLQAIASLPPERRKEILEPYIDRIAEDFQTDPELAEFEILDIEDRDREYDES